MLHQKLQQKQKIDGGPIGGQSLALHQLTSIPLVAVS
jgi:hypothetical protein